MGARLTVEPPPEIVAVARQRADARAARDFTTADRLRDEIAAAGWLVYSGLATQDHAATLRHVSAHRWQAFAHAWQWSMLWAPHSLAHQSHISAHNRQTCFTNGL